jgi:signal transduction histidine kinase
VLDNLIANAIEASADGTGALPELSIEQHPQRVLLSVSDRGSGVPPENREHIFSLFFTTKAKGSGIGLALSRKYIEQAGGVLRYTPRPGGGSVFTVELPCGKGGKAPNG